MSAVISRMPKFYARRGSPKTFVACIVARKIIALIRYRTAELRDFRREAFSLDNPAARGDGAARVQGDCVLDDIDDPAGASQVPRGVEEAELAEATQQVISGLPGDLRRLCEMLKTGTLADAARGLGIPRTTLINQVSRLQERFKAAGLKNFL